MAATPEISRQAIPAILDTTFCATVIFPSLVLRGLLLVVATLLLGDSATGLVFVGAVGVDIALLLNGMSLVRLSRFGING